MLKEFIETIHSHLLRRERRLIGDPLVNPFVYTFDPITGEIHANVTIPPLIKANVKTVRDIWVFVSYIESPFIQKGLNANVTMHTHSGDVTIWIGDTSVIAYKDTDRKAPSCEMKLDFHHAWTILKSLSLHAGWMDHGTFLRLLRHDLYGVLFSKSDFVEAVNSMKFESSASSESSFSAIGDNSVSKQAMAKATGAKEVPAEIEISFEALPGIPDVESDVTIRCGVLIDSVKATMRLMPRPGEFQQAELKIRTAIHTALRDDSLSSEDIEIFFGNIV